jgi:SAM-dependent MidA family methyltransferase
LVAPLQSGLAPSADALAHSRALVELIGAEVARSGGWIGFDRYMELALYAPGLGYYAGGATKFGGAGDFVTAPEISPLFGQTLSGQVGEVLSATGGDVLELGAGSGRMAADLLRGLAELGRLPARYRILEVSGDLAAPRSSASGLGAELASGIVWIEQFP